MTSRRDFLGIAAGAAFVAPTIAQAVASPRYASGGILVEGWAGGVIGESATDAILPFNDYISFQSMLDAPRIPNAALVRLMHSPTPWDIPNRLYGVTINEDGDAV